MRVLAVLLLLAGNVTLTPVIEPVKSVKYEEYFIEHEISASQAKNSALLTDFSSVLSPAGCQKCTAEEKRYCLGTDLINDHCCCDKRFHEVLPFIPHTCYLGTTLCKPIVEDCAEYNRLRTCCCDKFALEKWKRKSSAPSLSHTALLTLTLTALHFASHLT